LRPHPTSWPPRLGAIQTFHWPQTPYGCAITKTGDIHARSLLIEAAHSYRFPARVARHKLAAVDAVREAVRQIAWRAQTRLCQRHMMARGKLRQAAIARELAGFVWSIARVTSDPPMKTSAITTPSGQICGIMWQAPPRPCSRRDSPGRINQGQRQESHSGSAIPRRIIGLRAIMRGDYRA
jgi:hypothetical protein